MENKITKKEEGKRVSPYELWKAKLSEEEFEIAKAVAIQKGAETRKSNKAYQKEGRAIAKAIAGATITNVEGMEISGMGLLTMNLFQRAKSDSKDFKLFLELTGDLEKDNEESDGKVNVEAVINKIKVKR